MARILLRLSSALALILFLFSSCIQDEPLSPEADILFFDVKEDVGQIIPDLTGAPTDILVYYSKGDLTNEKLTPIIKITEGATISPSPDIPQNFSKTVVYTVTSQDRKHVRTYRITFTKVILDTYNFENWEINSNYHYATPYEYDGDNKISLWDSSNRGVVLYQRFDNQEDYPVHYTTNQQEIIRGERSAVMVTKVGPGSIFNIQYIPIVAGSLFTGRLVPLEAMKDPLLATKFGQPYYKLPKKFAGYYKYRSGAGDYIQSDGSRSPNKKDKCSVYAVFYERDSKLTTLDGTNILTDPHIVSVASISEEERLQSKGDGMAYFETNFEYRNGYTPASIDFETKKYSLAVIFSSSYNGDRYEGTPGSRLVVDDIKIINE